MQFKVFWCKVNKYYTDNWLNSKYLSDKTGIFIASCVVTDKAKRKWLKFVKDAAKELKVENQSWKLKEEKPKIYISWCWAFKKGKAQEDFFEIYPELKEFRDLIVILWEKPEELQREIDENKKEKSNNPLWKKENIFNDSEWPKGMLLSASSEWQQSWNTKSPSPLGGGLRRGLKGIKKLEKLKKLPQIYTKKFLLIQGWCDSFCSFCLTVQKRWRHYFRSKEDIVEEINEFEKGGWKEVVLTWVNLSAWGLPSTNPPKILTKKDKVEFSKFAELLEFILKNTTIPRVRISSMGPEFIDEKCLEIFKNTRIYPHFHYSVQSGSSNILKEMRRHYDWWYIRDLLLKTKNLKRDDKVEVSIWADLIVWFPGENEKDFLDTYNLVKDWLITKIHAFPFSAHNFWEKVPAWVFKDQVPDNIKKERMWRLEEIWDITRDNFIDRNIWKEFRVLIEVVKPSPLTTEGNSTENIKWKGWTENYIEADEKTFEILEGKIEKNNIVTWILK